MDAGIFEDDENTTLHNAALNNSMSIVDMLLRSGDVSVNAHNSKGHTPLHMASAKGHLGIINNLIQNNANVEEEDDLGNTALHFAAEKGHVPVCKALLRKNRKILDKYNNSSRTALHLAAGNGHSETVRYLLNEGADKNLTDGNGDTAFRLAVKNKKTQVSRIIIEHEGGPLSQRNDSVLAPGPSQEVPQPVHQPYIMQMQGAAPPYFPQAANQANLMQMASAAAFQGVPQTAIQAQPMQMAAAVPYGLDVRLHAAARKGAVPEIYSILSNGVNINCKDNTQSTALHIASKYGHTDFVRVLLEEGASCSERDKDGNIPLHLASDNNHLEIVELLVANDGTLVNSRNNYGKTPLDMAKVKVHMSIVRFLRNTSYVVET